MSPTRPPSPTRELTEEAEPLLRTVVLARRRDARDGDDDPVLARDGLLSTGRATALLGGSRATLVNWFEAGRIPLEWHGAHRRLRRSDVLAYRDRLR